LITRIAVWSVLLISWGCSKPGLPVTKKGTIEYADGPQPFTFTLVDGMHGPYAIPFTTYVPGDMKTASIASDQGNAVRFSYDLANLEIFFFKPGTTEAQARAWTREAAEKEVATKNENNQFWEPKAGDQYKWPLAQFRFIEGKAGIFGTVALGRHGDSFFRLTQRYPENYEEGFVPLAEQILAEWRWDDGGKGF